MKKTVFLAGVFVVVSAITTGGVIASQYGAGQTDKPKEGAKSKPTVTPHTMTGCLEKGSDENTFRLTNVEGTGPKMTELQADPKLKLSAHVGHKVAITGTDIDPKTLKNEAGTTTGASSKETIGEHHMRVSSMKHISPSCP